MSYPYFNGRNGGGFYPDAQTSDSGRALAMRVSDVMKRVYLKMVFAMLVSALVAWLCASSTAAMTYFATHSWVMWAIIIAEFGLVIGISAGVNRMSAPTATLLFYLFSAVNGLMLSQIFIVYSTASIAKTFVITAAVFGAMSVYGFCTKSDLTRWGQFLWYALLGLVVCCVINIFWANSTMEWIISIAGTLIFIGLTAWDTQQVKRMAMAAPAESVAKLATLGALTLYLDFINLFLFLLRFFGNSND